ncbi:MAG: hypothetical protein R3F43_06730 [bacterium]
MSTHRPPQDDQLLDLLYGEVLPEDAEALQALVNTDPVLRERLEAWSSVRRAMATLPEPEPDPQVHYNILRAARQQARPRRRSRAASSPGCRRWWRTPPSPAWA